MLNKSVESGHPYLIPDLRGDAFSFSPIEYDASCRFVMHDLIMLTYVPSMPTFWKVFVINGSWTLSKAFFVSIEMIVLFLLFYIDILYIILYFYYFYYSICWYGVSSWLICRCWKIFASQGWFSLDHAVWSF